ncbi:MAG: type 12 methyltransferase [Bacteroidetes bacterium]|nr:MAG: type 12 methyltransferase [Bacteroidota bacterium]
MEQSNQNKIESCPVCGSKEIEKKLQCRDFTVSKELFDIVSCKKCSFFFTNPQPEVSDLGRYYESDDYVSHSDTSKGIVNWLYQRVRKTTLKRKLKLVNRLSGQGKLLDIGCGTGHFLHTAKTGGWETIGIEPSESARKVAREKFGINAFEEDHLVQLQAQSFDVITMWHVLEHVPFLNERVAELKRLLKPGGVLIVAVPNHLSHDADHYKENWAAWDVPRHLWHFAPSDIKNLFGKQQMGVKEILPMKFDAYYVSMLSEKYKNGKTSLLAAFWRGWISNLKSGGDPPRCSSQIYIIRNND